jgi:hypothetical protein
MKILGLLALIVLGLPTHIEGRPLCARDDFGRYKGCCNDTGAQQEPYPPRIGGPLATYADAIPSLDDPIHQRRGLYRPQDPLGITPSMVREPELYGSVLDEQCFRPRFSIISIEWERIPASNDVIVIVGTVKTAKVYLNSRQTDFYSEFKVDVEQVYKGGIPIGQTIDVERQGGQLQVASSPKPNSNGITNSLNFSGPAIITHNQYPKGYPEVGKRYMLFLTQDKEDAQWFHIITGYTFIWGAVAPLDGGTIRDDYVNMKESQFISEVQTKLAHPTPNACPHPYFCKASDLPRIKAEARRARSKYSAAFKYNIGFSQYTKRTEYLSPHERLYGRQR